MINRLKSNLVTTILALGSMGVVAHAGAITTTFTFNSLSANDTAAQIATYMTSQLVAAGCAGCSVTVSGAVVDTTYNGEGHVVGPGGTSLTLGNSDGATSNSDSAAEHSGPDDSFIATTNDNSQQISTQIDLVFKGLTITNLGFDFEIFPEAGSNPDFELEAGNGGIVSPVSSFGTGGFVYGVDPGTTNGSSTQSPNSGTCKSCKETSPQYIGTWSGSVGGVDDIDFVDWPATIGVDNLSITFDPTNPVPEPSSIFLLGTGMLSFALALRKKLA